MAATDLRIGWRAVVTGSSVARQTLGSLTSRELEVLALLAEGRGNGEVAELLFVTPNAVHKHIGNIFAKFGLAPTDSGHRRVRAVLAYLERR